MRVQKRQDKPFVKLALVAPSLVLLGCVAVVPFLAVVVVSFTDLTPTRGMETVQWAGLRNYERLFSDTELHGALIRTFAFALIAVFCQIGLGTGIGEYLFRAWRARQRWFGLIVLPMVLAPVVVGLVWRLLMQGEFGALSLTLKFFGLFREVSITSSPTTALIAVCLVDIWQWTPLVAVAYLAARSLVTPSQMEAARIDGASESQVWAGVVLPLVTPTLLACAILRLLEAVREFDKVYVLTSGGPGSATELLSLYIWRVAFRAWDFGYGAALCVLFYFVVFAMTSVLLWALRDVLPILLRSGERGKSLT